MFSVCWGLSEGGVRMDGAGGSTCHGSPGENHPDPFLVISGDAPGLEPLVAPLQCSLVEVRTALNCWCS